MGEHFTPHPVPLALDPLDPLVRRLFLEMNAQRCSAQLLAERAGVNRNVIKDWRTRTVPNVRNLQAALNVLGLELKIVHTPENRGPHNASS